MANMANIANMAVLAESVICGSGSAQVKVDGPAAQGRAGSAR
jgi:hypothetical protein